MRFLKSYTYGGYEQIVKQDMDITCTCQHSTIHPDAFAKGETLCKHIKQLLKENHSQ